MKELINKINFHDSSVIEFIHTNDIVKIKIDLCMWKQEEYNEGDQEIKEGS